MAETQTQTLTPPAVLTPPEPVQPVAVADASGMIRLETEVVSGLDVKVSEFVDAVVTMDAHSPDFQAKVQAIHNMANDEVKKSASVSNRMLERPANAIDDGLFSDNNPVSQSLVELRHTVEDLDPSRQGDLLSPRKLFGIIPFGNKMRDYFSKYQSSQASINAIVESLYRGQDELRKDNAAIEQEKSNLWGVMHKLQEYIYVGQKIDEALEQRVAAIELKEPEKAKVVKEEMLFYVRQKVQDLLSQLAVSIQGYLALDMIRKNNLELIKGVDRASTTTVSALRTAVIVAQALTNQKLVLDQINALNTTTSSMIESTSALLKTQSTQIHEQAASSAISLDSLKNAFNNVYAAMDEMSDYKVRALDSMKQTVTALNGEVERAQKYLDKVREQEAKEATKGPAASDLVL